MKILKWRHKMAHLRSWRSHLHFIDFYCVYRWWWRRQGEFGVRSSQTLLFGWRFERCRRWEAEAWPSERRGFCSGGQAAPEKVQIKDQTCNSFRRFSPGVLAIKRFFFPLTSQNDIESTKTLKHGPFSIQIWTRELTCIYLSLQPTPKESLEKVMYRPNKKRSKKTRRQEKHQVSANLVLIVYMFDLRVTLKEGQK